MSAYCTACGAPRMPLANASVTLAGQPSKVGGTVARVFGWTVLGGGWLLAALLAGLIVLLGGTWGAVIAATPIALIASVIAYALLRGGKQLRQSGDTAEAATKNQAIFALANARNGVLKAEDVARMLDVSVKEGDDILTKLAKELHEQVNVDIDDDGNVLYRFPSTHWGGLPQMAPNAAHVRVDVPPPMRVETREPLPPEETGVADPARQKAR